MTGNISSFCSFMRFIAGRKLPRSVPPADVDEMFDALYPDAAVPKGGWRWIESAQYRLLRGCGGS
jgi:hypothetical protein